MDTAGLSQREWKRLEGLFLFRGLEREGLEEMLRDPRCTRKRCTRGIVVYSPQVYASSLGVLLSGRLEVSKEHLIVSTLGPGELFGAAALFQTGGAYATTLTARTECDVVIFPQELVEELFRRDGGAAMAYIRYLSDRVRFLSGKLDQLLAGGAEARLARYLVSRGTEDGVAALDCSLTGLAARLNVSRASLYRAFATLEDLGIVNRQGRQVHILDDVRLRSLQDPSQGTEL